MNEVLTSFLFHKNANTSHLAATLIEKQEDVICAFGGITNIIELCLTNPNVSQHIDPNSKQFQQFVQLIQNNSKTNLSNPIVLVDHDHDENKPISTTHTSQMITLHTKQDYNHCKLIIESSAKNSLCFKLIDNKNVAKSIYKFILSKKSLVLFV